MLNTGFEIERSAPLFDIAALFELHNACVDSAFSFCFIKAARRTRFFYVRHSDALLRGRRPLSLFKE